MNTIAKTIAYLIILSSAINSYSAENFLFNIKKSTPFEKSPLKIYNFNCYIVYEQTVNSLKCTFGSLERHLNFHASSGSMQVEQDDGDIKISYQKNNNSSNPIKLTLERNTIKAHISIHFDSNKMKYYAYGRLKSNTDDWINRIFINADDNSISLAQIYSGH